MKGPRILVYIDTRAGYYSRWVERTRTHRFEGAGVVEPYWIEMLRMAPETWDPIEPTE